MLWQQITLYLLFSTRYNKFMLFLNEIQLFISSVEPALQLPNQFHIQSIYRQNWCFIIVLTLSYGFEWTSRTIFNYWSCILNLRDEKYMEKPKEGWWWRSLPQSSGRIPAMLRIEFIYYSRLKTLKSQELRVDKGAWFPPHFYFLKNKFLNI